MEEKKLKKRRLLAIMMAALALSSVGVETATSLNNTESVVEAKARKKHHKRRAVRRRKNKKRKNIRKEYFKNKTYYDNGIVMPMPKRFNFTLDNLYTDKWGYDADGNFLSEQYIGFRTTIKNNSNHSINVADFLKKHLQLIDTKSNNFPISNNINRSDYRIGEFNGAFIFENGDFDYRQKNQDWKQYLKNFDKSLAKKRSMTVLFVHWVPDQNALNQYYLLKLKNNKGKQIKEYLYPGGTSVIG